MGDRGLVNTVGKPDEVAPHVRFDERRLGRFRPNQSPTLLGFHHRLVKSWRTGKHSCQRWPSRRAMASLKAKIKAIAAPRWRLKEPIDVIVEEFNQVLRGWCNYFRWGNSSRQFSRLDNYVYERLALFDSKKRQKRGRRWKRHTRAWLSQLGVFRLAGTVRYLRSATATT